MISFVNSKNINITSVEMNATNNPNKYLSILYLIKHQTDESQRKQKCKGDFSNWNAKIRQRKHKPT